MYREFFQFPDLTNHFYPGIHAAGLAISVGCAVLGSLRGSRAVLRLQPAEAMRPQPPRQGGACSWNASRWFWRSLELRLADGAAQRAPQPAAHGRRRVRRGDGRQRAGQRLHDGRRRSTYLIDFQFRWILRSDMDLTLQGRARATRPCSRRPGCRASTAPSRCSTSPARSPTARTAKKGSITGLRPRRQLTVPRDIDGPADPHSRGRPGHEPQAGRDAAPRAAATWSPSSRSRALRRAQRRAGRRDRRQLPGHCRLRRHPLPEPAGRRGTGHQRRATGDRRRPGRPRSALPRTEADAGPAGRHRPGRHDRRASKTPCSRNQWVFIDLLVVLRRRSSSSAAS